MLGLRLCARAFSSCGEWGPLFITVRGPLTIVASLVAEHRLQTRRLSNCGSRAQLLCSMWDLPRPGPEPVSPASAGRFSTTAPPGKPPTNNIYACNSLLSAKALKRSKWLYSNLNGFSTRVFSIHLATACTTPYCLYTPSYPNYYTRLCFLLSLCWIFICRPLCREGKNLGEKLTFEGRPETKKWSLER